MNPSRLFIAILFAEEYCSTFSMTTAGLSNREIDTLKQMADDLSNQEIADKLFISLNTVKTHVKNIYLKLEADNRTKAIAKAKELEII